MQVFSRIFSSKIQLIYNAFSLVGQREKCFYSRIETFLTANRKYSDREQKTF